METRTCQECGEVLRGRIDQRFCSDQCRSTYHNRRKAAPSELMRRINRVLRKNYRIFCAAHPNGKARVSGDFLRAQGFHFPYFTHPYRTQAGKTYYFVYEQGYLALDDGSYALVINHKLRV
jgi:predicted nucleic acid-binding Zn ribbon protein